MNHHRMMCGVALFFLLVGAYLLTYRGFPLSQDGIFIFDTTESLVNRGAFNRTYEYTRYNDLTIDSMGAPWAPSVQEPLINILLAPLYAVGRALPDVGTVHVTWLFNIFITALTAVSLYWGALLLGYPVGTAWFAGLIYGIATLAFPYARFLFREPLMTLLVLWCFVLVMLIRDRAGRASSTTELRGDDYLTRPHPPAPSPLRREGEQRRSRRLLKSPLRALGRGSRGGVRNRSERSTNRAYYQDAPTHSPLMVMVIVVFIAALLTKAISLLILPSLLVLILPARITRRMVLLAGGLLLLIVFMLVLVNWLGIASWRYSFDYWLAELRRLEWGLVVESLLGYQVSFSRSVWLHSPVLLAGLVGTWMLWRRGDWRQVVSPVVLLLVLSAAYGVAQRVSWWGSWGWGPRYMLPLIPVVMLLWVLPVMDDLFRAKHAVSLRWVLRVVFVGLVLLGMLLQLLGMAVLLPNYYTDLNRADLLVEWSTQQPWGAYNWTWEWSPLRYHLERLDLSLLDSAWRYADPGWIAPLLAMGLMLAAGVWAWWLLRRARYAVSPPSPVPFPHQEGRGEDINPSPIKREGFGVGEEVVPRRAPLQRQNWLITGVVTGGLSALTLITIGAGMVSLRDDSRYIEQWSDVRELVGVLDPQVARDQVVFVDREQYLPIFMNYFKTPAVVAALPYSPAEDYGDGPEVISDDIVEQIGFPAYYALTWAAGNIDTVWLVASSSPFEPEKMRPVERFLALNYFPVNEIAVSNRARAIRYRMVSAQQVGAAEVSNYAFDDVLRLEGFNLPLGTAYAPDEVVPVTLVWQALEPLPEDYNVSVQIATSDGVPVAQRDGQPQGTFGAMTRWLPGESNFDHHGVQLPADLAPGTYQLQVVVYRWQDGTRLSYGDGDVARLVEITVR